MYCSNCGNKLASKDKFCSKCGMTVSRASSYIHKEYAALSKLNLLHGVNVWLKEEKTKYPNSKPVLAMEKTLESYPERYNSKSKFMNAVLPDTKEIIFSHDVGGIIQTGFNQEELERLTQTEKNKFDEYLPFLNGIRADTIVIGYMCRMFSEIANSAAKLNEFSGVKTPQEYFERIGSTSEEYPDMFADAGFMYPFGFVHEITEAVVTISKNALKTHKIAKVFIFPESPSKSPSGNSMFLIMFMTGWCLARFDLYRKGKLTEISL